jgi:hypothetical protein
MRSSSRSIEGVAVDAAALEGVPSGLRREPIAATRAPVY